MPEPWSLAVQVLQRGAALLTGVCELCAAVAAPSALPRAYRPHSATREPNGCGGSPSREELLL